MKTALSYLSAAVMASVIVLIAAAYNVAYLHPRPLTRSEIALIAIYEILVIIYLTVSERLKERTK